MVGFFLGCSCTLLSTKKGNLSQLNSGRDRRLGDMSPNKPHIQILIGKWIEFLVYLGQFPNAEFLPIANSTHIHPLGIQAFPECKISSCSKQHTHTPIGDLGIFECTPQHANCNYSNITLIIYQILNIT